MKCNYDCFSCPYEDCINDSNPTTEEIEIIGDDGRKTPAKKREYMRDYYKEHKEKIRAYNRQYRAKHRDKLNKYRNDYYYTHHEYEVERQRRYDERKKGV